MHDIPRLFTAAAEWAACMVYALTLKKRFRPALFYPLCAAFLGVFCGLQTVAGLLPISFWIPGMIAAMVAVYFCIFTLCKVKPLDAAFWAARAFILAEFAAAFEWQFYYYLTQNLSGAAHLAVKIVFMLIVYAFIYVFIFFLEKRYKKSNLHINIAPKNLITALFTAAIIFIISNLSFVSKNTPLSGSTVSEIFYIRTLVDFCGVILFYAQAEQQLWLTAKHELDAMQNVLSRQYEQYMMSKENIEMLNRRYHDLKHQIAVIKAENNPDKRNAYLEELETGIKMFEAQNKTGNKVLDILLTGKNMLCVQNNINFTCVADGSLLDFMDAMDLCSIVGNALDNAIESVLKLGEPEKRLIKMAVYKKDNFVMLRFENYIKDKLVLEKGIPVTTKDNREFHGYGIKSIQATSEKYGGNIKISTENNWFTLCVLLPVNN